jgi:hypothetical protein
VTTTIHAEQLYAEDALFAQGIVTGEFAFLAQDGGVKQRLNGNNT